MRARQTVRPGWPGERFSPGGLVKFHDRQGHQVTGKVVELRANYAIVAGGRDGRWRVGYAVLTDQERARPDCSLAEVENMANTLLKEQREQRRLTDDWHVVFDLAPARAGQCVHEEHRIYLSVGHCLKASRAEIRDTILHEIAHALAGPDHHHDADWRRIARAIGCTAERCTTTLHAVGRWVARCGCGHTHSRHRLTSRMRTDGICRACRGPLSWRVDHDGDGID